MFLGIHTAQSVTNGGKSVDYEYVENICLERLWCSICSSTYVVSKRNSSKIQGVPPLTVISTVKLQAEAHVAIQEIRNFAF